MLIGCVISYKNLHYRTFAALMQGRHGLLACGRNIVACTLPKPAGAWPGGKPQPRRHQVVGLSLQGAFQYRPFGVAIRAVRQCNAGCFATQNGPYCNALNARVLAVLCSAASCRVLPEGMVNCGRGASVASMWSQPAHAASHGRWRWLPPAPWPTGRLRRGRRPGLHFYSVQWLLFAIFFVILQAHSGT